MFVEILLSLFLILILWTFNSCWVKPRKIMRSYQNQLKNTKYVTKIIPYKLFYNRFISPILEGKKLGDPGLHYKTQFPKYDIVVSNVMNAPYIQFGHIDFFNDFYSMDKHYQFPKIRLFSDPLIKLLGTNLIFSEGSVWKKKRTLLNKIFTFDFIKTQIPNIVQICDQRIAEMEEKATKGEDENGRYVQCYILNDLLTSIFSSIIFTGFIGIKERYEIDGIEAYKYLLSIIDDLSQFRMISKTSILGNWFYNLQLRKIDKSINERTKKVTEWGIKTLSLQLKKIQLQIEEKGKQIVVDNIFKAYVLEKKQKNISDDLLSNKDIFAEFMGFVFAGTDTTSNYLNVIIAYIAKHPEVEKELRKQIEEYMKEEDYSYENLKKFKYIDALQKQTTRAYGPANLLFLREAKVDNYLNGIAIKKGTLVSANCYANHYSEKYFKEPMKFRPERWLNGQCDHLDPFVLMGFSGGARTCIGKHLALLQSKIALIKIMKRYKKITLGIENFKWDKKLFTMPEYFLTKLTINENK